MPGGLSARRGCRRAPPFQGRGDELHKGSDSRPPPQAGVGQQPEFGGRRRDGLAEPAPGRGEGLGPGTAWLGARRLDAYRLACRTPLVTMGVSDHGENAGRG
ncbi:hypothetical protein NCCP2165_22710 [Halomonas sp. NCCP-2165]|nr:hypothetical protein NCCP2165_22710 [Halomonas sp. NCCP-2165]